MNVDQNVKCVAVEELLLLQFIFNLITSCSDTALMMMIRQGEEEEDSSSPSDLLTMCRSMFILHNKIK